MDRDDREVALELRVHASECLHEIPVVFALEQVHDHFGVGLGLEPVALRKQVLAQLAVVLDDAVEHDRELPLFAARQRMRVRLGDSTVCRPARVTETVPRGRAVRPSSVDEILQVADGAYVVEAGDLPERDSRGVVTAVLEPAQPAEQERLRLPRAHVSDDSAHSDRLSLPP